MIPTLKHFKKRFLDLMRYSEGFIIQTELYNQVGI